MVFARKARQGKASRFRIAWSESLQQALGEGLSLVVWYLALDCLGWGNGGPEGEQPAEEVVGCVDSGLVSLRMKSVLPGGRLVYCLQEPGVFPGPKEGIKASD